jgi:Ca2+-binding RTX toxin-like protein
MPYIRGKWTGSASADNDHYHDELVGTGVMDAIYGLGGYDTVGDGGGPDRPYGGENSDYGNDGSDNDDGDGSDLHGPGNAQPSNSETKGGDANNQIYGGDDDEIIDGGGGNDAIYGGGGDDTLSGNKDYPHDGSNPAETDWLFGEDGDDKLYGDNGDDFLYGGDGWDELAGNEGNDLLDGGSGNDVLSGGPGSDWLTGGSDYDTFEYIFAGSESPADDPDQIMDFTDTQDLIDVGEAGEPFWDPWVSYAEDTISSGGYDSAKVHAVSLLNGGLLEESHTFVFVTDGIDGYLFADFMENGTLDMGIILKGLASVSDFDFNNII